MTELKTTPKYGARECGCWFDGCRGIYIGEAVIAEAKAHGFEVKDIHPPYVDSAFYHELTDEAEDYMQRFATEGYYFGYAEDGDSWGLWEHENE